MMYADEFTHRGSEDHLGMSDDWYGSDEEEGGRVARVPMKSSGASQSTLQTEIHSGSSSDDSSSDNEDQDSTGSHDDGDKNKTIKAHNFTQYKDSPPLASEINASMRSTSSRSTSSTMRQQTGNAFERQFAEYNKHARRTSMSNSASTMWESIQTFFGGFGSSSTGLGDSNRNIMAFRNSEFTATSSSSYGVTDESSPRWNGSGTGGSNYAWRGAQMVQVGKVCMLLMVLATAISGITLTALLAAARDTVQPIFVGGTQLDELETEIYNMEQAKLAQDPNATIVSHNWKAEQLMEQELEALEHAHDGQHYDPYQSSLDEDQLKELPDDDYLVHDHAALKLFEQEKQDAVKKEKRHKHHEKKIQQQQQQQQQQQAAEDAGTTTTTTAGAGDLPEQVQVEQEATEASPVVVEAEEEASPAVEEQVPVEEEEEDEATEASVAAAEDEPAEAQPTKAGKHHHHHDQDNTQEEQQPEETQSGDTNSPTGEDDHE